MTELIARIHGCCNQITISHKVGGALEATRPIAGWLPMAPPTKIDIVTVCYSHNFLSSYPEKLALTVIWITRYQSRINSTQSWGVATNTTWVYIKRFWTYALYNSHVKLNGSHAWWVSHCQLSQPTLPLPLHNILIMDLVTCILYAHTLSSPTTLNTLSTSILLGWQYCDVSQI